MFNLCMITMDRSPRENSVFRTIDSLSKGGVFGSKLLNALHVSVSNHSTEFLLSNSEFNLATSRLDAFLLSTPPCNRSHWLACENAGYALIGAALPDDESTMVVFIEDDILVCAHFLESLQAWLDDLSLFPWINRRRTLFALGTPYPLAKSYESGEFCVPYPGGFYGTQCIMMSPRLANELGNYIFGNPIVRGVHSPGAYDLMMSEYCVAREIPIVSSVPSFVQHNAGSSVIAPDRTKHHTFDSFLGESWSYVKEIQQITELFGQKGK